MAYPGPVFPDNRKRGFDYPYSKKTQVQFGGYDHRKAAGDMSWYDSVNMTADYAPILASRAPFYRIITNISDFNGMVSGDEIFVAHGTLLSKVFFTSGSAGLATCGTLTNTQKVMCIYGNRVVIFPDKKMYNMTTSTMENMEAHLTPSAITFFSGTYEGEDATANCVYLDGNYSTTLHVNDAIFISGCTTHPENNLSLIIREIELRSKEDPDTPGTYIYKTVLHFYDNSFVFGDSDTVSIMGADGNIEVVNGYTESGQNLKVDRNVPDLDILFVHENRLWGAKGDSIHASANGDPFNWNNFDLTGLESWTVDVIDEGDFTGGCSYLGYPIFFKDNHIYKVYGSIPSEFQLVQSADLGVEPGSGKSLAIAGEKLFYLSRVGVMCYTGSLPQIISQPLGDVKYHNGIAGTDGVKYWISLEKASGGREQFVYDTQTGIWQRQTPAMYAFAWCYKGLFAIMPSETAQSGHTLIFLGDANDRPPVSQVLSSYTWTLESNDFTEYSPQRKWFGPRVEIRAEIAADSGFSVYVKHTNAQEWQLVGGPFTATGKHSFICSKIPARTDFYKIKITGYGRVWIYSIAPMTDQGSSDFGYNGG